MRLELKFNLEKPEIALDYRRIILSWLKSSLTICNQGKYFDKYFSGTEPKDYSFTVVFPKPEFHKEKIILEKPQMKILFSADDRNKTGLIFFSAFLGMKNKKFSLADENAMILKGVHQMKEHIVTKSEVLFQTCLGNGLCIREHDRQSNRDRFVTCEDQDFKEKALQVLKIQARLAGYPETMTEDLSIEPIICKKLLVYHYGRYVDTTTGIFKMCGNSQILQYFYRAGAGSKHSSGFGMVRVLQ